MLALHVNAQFNKQNVPQNDLPKEISFEGELCQAVLLEAYADSFMVVCSTKKIVRNAYSQSADLVIACYLKQSNGYTLYWRIIEYLDLCDAELLVNPFAEATEATDLNYDGSPEIWIVYQFGCKHPSDGVMQKLIVYERTKKMSLKGLTGQKVTKTADPLLQFDAALKGSEGSFRKYASEKWLRFANFME